MTDTEAHFRLLARQYLDLWQEQMAALAQDPQTADLWAKGMDWSRYMQANPLFAQSLMQNPLQAGAYANLASYGSPAAQSPAAAPTGATPVAPASGEPSDDVRRCREHIKELEQRVLALEAALAAKSRRPATRAKKTKPE